MEHVTRIIVDTRQFILANIGGSCVTVVFLRRQRLWSLAAVGFWVLGSEAARCRSPSSSSSSSSNSSSSSSSSTGDCAIVVGAR